MLQAIPANHHPKDLCSPCIRLLSAIRLEANSPKDTNDVYERPSTLRGGTVTSFSGRAPPGPETQRICR